MTRRKGGRRLLAALFVGAGVLAFVALGRRYSRYAVAGASMSPAYNEGDWLVVDLNAFRRRLPRPGEVIVLHDPRESRRRIIKRVFAVTLHGELDVRGDNAAESTDSRAFGLISASHVIGKVRWRFRNASRTRV